MAPQRLMGIDWGTRRVGVALGDDGSRLATPLVVLEISNPEQALEGVLKLIEREQPDQVVVGLPLNMDDSRGPAAVQAMQWGRILAERSGKPVVFVDERLSSFAAEETLGARRKSGEKLTRGKKKKRLDALAAADFLQSYLEGQLKPVLE